MNDPETKVVRGGARHLPLVYTAKEACEAVTGMLRDMVDNVGSEQFYANLMAAVAHGKLIALGFVDGTVVFGLPAAAPWKRTEQT